MTKNTKFEDKGMVLTIKEWSLYQKVTIQTIIRRIKRTGSAYKVEPPKKKKTKFEVISTPKSPQKYKARGLCMTAQEWGQFENVTAATIRSRVKMYGSPIKKYKPLQPTGESTYKVGGLTLTIKEWARRLDVSQASAYKMLDEINRTL